MYVLKDNKGYCLAGTWPDRTPVYSQLRAIPFNSVAEAEAKKLTIHRAHRANFEVAPMPSEFVTA
jgi:hypothetical protein